MADDQLAFDFGGSPPSQGSAPALPRAAVLARRLGALAREGIYLGTSSWKYPGWLGQIYDPARYHTRGRLSEKRFNDTCLGEYATIFPTVCGDFSFYQFPSPSVWKEMFDQTPDGFRLSLKVPEEITVERYPDLPRYGRRAGEPNPHFMDAGLLKDQLLGPLEAHRAKLGALILEFGTIHGGPHRETTAFAARLDRMFADLPTDRFAFSVEVRNREFLDGGAYLNGLRAHRVAHCFNSWTRMPALSKQLDIPGVFTTGHVVARLLLRPGRTYEQAVRKFAPYERVQEVYPDGRDALRRLINHCRLHKQMLFAFVNNRFEGNAVETIESVLDP